MKQKVEDHLNAYRYLGLELLAEGRRNSQRLQLGEELARGFGLIVGHEQADALGAAFHRDPDSDPASLNAAPAV